jgi:hypothetical protein
MTIYKTKIKKYAGGAGLAKLAGTMGKVGDVAQKVAPIASAVGQMLPQEQNQFEPNANTKNQIKSVGNAVSGAALDSFVPGSSALLGVTDGLSKATGVELNPINSTVDFGENLIAGDTAALAKSTLIGKGLSALGVNFGDSRGDKAKRQAEIDAVTNANLQAQKNNAGANARYVKHGGSINRILRASKGLSFQLGLIQPKQNEFKVGGVLPSYHTNKNVILAGVLHKHNHDICELEDKSCGVIYGKKGIPVVSNNQKVAEIEKEELVFTKEVAKQIEVLVTKYNKSKSNDVKLELGKYIYEQLNVNTIDNTKI